MDEREPEIPVDVLETLDRWVRMAESDYGTQMTGDSKLRLAQAAMAVAALVESARSGPVVLMQPAITYAKITYLMLAVADASRDTDAASDVAIVRAWLSRCRT